MPILYEIFYIKNTTSLEETIKKMNILITNKIRDGWNPVGGITWTYDHGTCVAINQAMTLTL